MRGVEMTRRDFATTNKEKPTVSAKHEAFAGLSAGVRGEIERLTGPILDVLDDGAGRNSHLSTRLVTATGAVFIKG